MKHRDKQYVFCFWLVLFLFLLLYACTREYSFEVGTVPPVVPDSTNVIDTTTTDKDTIPACAGCREADPTTVHQWRFRTGNTYLCGRITKAVATPDGDGMTFFGPSSCSADSGLIITAMFADKAFRKDGQNVTALQTSLQYYDNTTGVDLLQSKRPKPFSLLLQQYIHQTRTATGTFQGLVVDKKGRTITVEAGSFTIRLE